MIRATSSIALLGAVTVSLGLAPAFAQEATLPNVIAWSAYDTGSSGYAQAVAIGAALQNNLGTTLRILPGRNDISRMIPLREGSVHFSAAGIAAYYAQEGTDVFLSPDWGPQPIRLLLSSNPDHNQGLAASEESGIETLEDIRGRRVAAVVGSPAINNGTEAILAFAGLTLDDVELIEFPGYGASWEGMLNGQVDVAWGATTLGNAYQMASSPRGLHWLPVPHDDEEGWERLTAVAPHIFPNIATEGANISPEQPHEGTNYPYPILITMADQDAGLVEAMTRAMLDLFPEYEGAAPGIDGWALDRQTLQWIMPYHEGAIAVLREEGVWTDEHQAHNERLIERQEALRAAWDELMAEGVSEAELPDAWEERLAAIDG